MMTTASGSGALPISQESQPDLWLLVHDTAARLGVPAPREIALYPSPEVLAADDRLLLGLPYVFDLPADELAAVIAHELVHLHSPTGAWTADALVAQVVSPESVAAALVHASYLSLTFERFVLRYVGPLAAAGWYPVDLWTAWRWTLRQDRNRFDLPELAGRVTALLGTPDLPDPIPGVRSVPLRPLGVEAEAGFAKAIAERLTTATPQPAQDDTLCLTSAHLLPCSSTLLLNTAPEGLRAVTFDAVDEQVWDDAAGQCVTRIREVVAELYGHPVIFPVHVLELVQQGRSAEILRLCGADSPDLFPVARVLGPMLSDALRRRGYRNENILQQHLFTGPAFDHLDINTLIDPVDRGEPAPQELVDLLT